MILIVSEKYDSQTDTVMDWLTYYGYEVIRINDHDSVIVENIRIANTGTNYQIKIKTEIGKFILVDSSKIECVWYRRGDFIIHNFIQEVTGIEPRFISSFKEHVKGNNDVVKTFFHRLCKEKQIGNYFDNTTNKLLNLDLAQKTGFKIPATIVTSQKKVLIEFLANHSRVITKGIRVNGFEITNELCCTCLTSEIDQKTAHDLPNTFAPSLFQELITKSLELRIFYFNKKCFSVAMLTQLNPKTMLDFRNYDNALPMRIIPFILPPKIHKMIESFMEQLEMTTGSIDLMVDNNQKYYFLEVNPVGQFGFISNWCNAIIEREIALELTQIGYGRA